MRSRKTVGSNTPSPVNRLSSETIKDTCRKRHFSQVCDDLSECLNIENCKKRYAKTCKRFVASSVYKFKDDCAYHHKIITDQEDMEIIK